MAKAVQGFTPEAMRARFQELKDQVDAIEAQAAPKREERDKLVNKMDEKIAALEAEYQEIEKPLYDLKNEMGAISRFLKGKTSDEAAQTDE